MLNGIKNLSNLKKLIGNTFNTSRASGEFLLRKTDFGTINVESDIIRQVVERTRVEGVNEVKNVVIDAPTAKYPLNIKFNLIIRPNHSAPVIGASLRDAIKEQLQNFMDINDVNFDIRVTQINQQQTNTKKKRRVR